MSRMMFVTTLQTKMMEDYLTGKGLDFIKDSIRNPDQKYDAQNLWAINWLHKLIQEVEIPKVYICMMVELGYLEPKIVQDLDLQEAYAKMRAYGAELIQKADLSESEKRLAYLGLWDEEDL